MRSSDFPRTIPTRFVPFACRYRTCVVCSLLQAPTRLLQARACICRLPIRPLMRRSWDLPGSCGILVLMPRSSTPVRLPRLAIPAVPCCLPLCARRRLSRLPFFRGSFTRPVHSLCTLRSSGCPKTTQHSVLGWWLAFAGRDSHPLDTYARFQSFLHHVPLAQAFLAHAHYGQRSRWRPPWPGGSVSSGVPCDHRMPLTR
jgi:hypothetical protein